MMRVVVAVFLLILVGVGAIGWVGCKRGLHPERAPKKYYLSDFNLPGLETVHFKSRDGFRLAGWFVQGINGATIILAHGRGGDKTWMLPHADYLHRDGFSVLMFDFRHRGESEGDAQTLGAKESWDIESAVAYLKKRSDVDPARIGVLGNSLGAASAILAAAEMRDIKGVVAESSFTSINDAMWWTFPRIVGLPSFPFAPVSKFICELRLGVDLDAVAPIKAIAKISPRPVFLIDNLEDNLFPSDSAETLYAASREPKRLWQIPGCPHGQGWVCAPGEYERRVLDFWRKTFELNHSGKLNEKIPNHPGDKLAILSRKG
jgi:fermentation-respiration switch protein FrsA (DUF1100 family)